MEHYDAPAIADPFAQAASFFTSLLQEFSGNSALGLPHHTLEEMAATGGREVARLLLQGCLDLRAEREEKALATLAPTARTRIGRGRGRLERGHHRALATVVGTVQVTRCALRAPGRVAVHPADAALALPRERHSMGLRRLAVLESVRGSYDAALEGIDRVCGRRLCGKRQLEHLVRQAAVDVASFYAVRTPEPATASTLLVMSVDGKGIVCDTRSHVLSGERQGGRLCGDVISGQCSMACPHLGVRRG